MSSRAAILSGPWSGRDWVAGLTLAALLVAGGAVRLQGVSEPIVAFHPLRHYRSALIARACYYEATPSTPAWALAIARANRDIQQAGEPPVMEWMACSAYRVLGREELAVPRTLAILWWLVGSIATYLLGRRTISVEGGLLAATLHLFLPYSILATRTFQPDPLMTTCTAWALLALVRWNDHPNRRRLVTAALLAGAALFVKPMSVFIVIPAMAVVVSRRAELPSDRRSSGDVLAMLSLSLAPSCLFYGSSLVFGRLAQDQLGTRFVPSLLVTPFFWMGIARQLRTVLGWVTVALAAVGTVVASDRLLRRLLVAIWIGYAIFAVAFTYHTATHDYYHLPFVPVAALAVAAAVDRLWSALRLRATTSLAVTCAICALVAWQGEAAAAPRLHRPDASALVADYQRIGEVTHHDGQIVFLDLEYGYPLMYHAEVAGDAWPGSDDLEAERLDGRPIRSASERLDTDYPRPRYFVVTDLSSLNAQAELQALLAAKATLVDVTAFHRVYRMSEPAPDSERDR